MTGKGKKRKVKVVFPLRELLQRYGWSQRKLSRASGIAPNRITAIYHGRQLPGWQTVLRIVTTLGASLGDLAPGKEEVA